MRPEKFAPVVRWLGIGHVHCILTCVSKVEIDDRIESSIFRYIYVLLNSFVTIEQYIKSYLDFVPVSCQVASSVDCKSIRHANPSSPTDIRNRSQHLDFLLIFSAPRKSVEMKSPNKSFATTTAEPNDC